MRCVVALALVIAVVGACGDAPDATAPDTSQAASVTATLAPTSPPTVPATTTTVPPATTAPTTTAPPTTPPPASPVVLTVTHPLPDEHMDHRACEFTGTAAPGITVTAAGTYPVEVADDGTWSAVLMLTPGGNVATFTASDATGDLAKVRVPVFYDPPLELRPDGLGVISFDDPMEQAAATLIATLGPPASDETITSDTLAEDVGAVFSATGYAAVDFARFMQWERPQLMVMFSDSAGDRDPVPPIFNGWIYRGPGAPLGPTLATPEGITIAASVADLEAAFGSSLWMSDQQDEITGHWHWHASSIPSPWWADDALHLRGLFDGDPGVRGTMVTEISAGFGFDEC